VYSQEKVLAGTPHQQEILIKALALKPLLRVITLVFE
jgi:hypothetical protein